MFTRYDERDFRVDAEVRHWQWDSYAQDSWRLTPRFTMDYGLRVTHHGAVYETREMNSAFDPALWQASQAMARLSDEQQPLRNQGFDDQIRGLQRLLQ